MIAPKGSEPKDVLSFHRSNDFKHVGDEVRATRERVGVTEIANLAKYEFSGQGAEVFLSRLMTNKMKRLGRLVLDRCVDNFFAETEQVAFMTMNVPPGIDFSNDPLLQGRLVHWQHDTFVARWDDRGLRADAFVTFAIGPDGRVEQARMRAVSPDTDFSFDFHDLLLKPKR